MANKMPQPVPDAALDALDRGIIEAALTAAGAIARVSALETTVAELRE
jgi:hypothetical protein